MRKPKTVWLDSCGFWKNCWTDPTRPGGELGEKTNRYRRNQWQWVISSNLLWPQAVRAPQDQLSVLNRGKATFGGGFRPQPKPLVGFWLSVKATTGWKPNQTDPKLLNWIGWCIQLNMVSKPEVLSSNPNWREPTSEGDCWTISKLSISSHQFKLLG